MGVHVLNPKEYKSTNQKQNSNSAQKAVFAKFPDLRSFALANVASVDTREALYKHFGLLR